MYPRVRLFWIYTTVSFFKKKNLLPSPCVCVCVLKILSILKINKKKLSHCLPLIENATLKYDMGKRVCTCLIDDLKSW